MANFLMPKGHVRSSEADASTDAGVTGDTDVTNAVYEREVALGRGPIGDLAAGPTAVAAVSPGSATVTLLDPATLSLRAEVALGGEPTGVAVSDDRAFVSTSSMQQDAVTVLDLETGAVTATFPVASEITALAVGPDGKRLYAARATGDRLEVTVIDVTAERAGTIDIGRGPAANIDALALDPRGRRLFVAITDDDGSHLLSVDTETARVRHVMPVGSPLRDVACAGDTVYALTSDRAVGGAVHVIDLATAKVTGTVVVGGAPTQLSLSRDEARVYVVDYDRVHVICTMRLEPVDSLAIGTRPSCVAHSADGSRVFVADYAGAVHVFSVESTIGMLYAHLLATDSLALDVPRRQAITV
jgi:DNA-binding beta-propeller fold protein YncE